MDYQKTEPNPAIRRAPVLRPPKVSGRLRLIGRVAAGLLALVLLIWMIRPSPQPQTGGRFGLNMPMAVGTATAEKGDVRVTLNALGTVTPLATVTVRTQISGQLMQIAFQEGQNVQKGDFLAQVDPRPYQAQLAQAEGQLARDQALLKNAELDLARYQTLVKEDSIARQQLDTQAALVRQYQGTVVADQATVDNAKLNVAYCHIVAPVSGRVGLRLVDQGNYVQVGDAGGLVVITQLHPITVIFTLPEDNLPAINKRLRAGAALETTAFDRANSNKLATGKLMTIDNQIDTTTGTFKLRAQFDNDDETLYPNQFVNTQLLVDVLHDQTVVPTAAIQRGAPGTFVYLVAPDSTVSVRPVKLGPTEGQRVAIESGLAPGDVVVTDGADRLRDGAKVVLPGAPPPDAAGNGQHRHRGETGGGPGGGQSGPGQGTKPAGNPPPQ